MLRKCWSLASLLFMPFVKWSRKKMQWWLSSHSSDFFLTCQSGSLQCTQLRTIQEKLNVRATYKDVGRCKGTQRQAGSPGLSQLSLKKQEERVPRYRKGRDEERATLLWVWPLAEGHSQPEGAPAEGRKGKKQPHFPLILSSIFFWGSPLANCKWKLVDKEPS